jgi:fructose-bisphosphate aldolase class I
VNNLLHETAQKLVKSPKGILASDERPSSANKNLKKAGIEPSDEMRQKLRELFINTPEIENYINGIILQDETFWQKDAKGRLFRETLLEKGITVIIKVDGGTIEMPGFPEEKITTGLDGLSTRLERYFHNGARAAKWRSIFKIGKGLPTPENIEANSIGLAEYAMFCQKANIVPIVEPEVLLDGDHTIEKAEKVTTKVLKAVFDYLKDYRVDLRGVILKSSMVLPGKESSQIKSPQEIAESTVRTLLKTVPNDVPGVVFLSGGQGPEEATSNLNEIAQKEPLPWDITFSYLRAIEGPATKIWAGKDDNIQAAREEFLKRLRLNVEADKGIYSKNLEK